MTRTTVAVVDLGRPGALGARRRVETWERIFTAAGATVELVSLTQDCRTPSNRLLPAVVAAGADPLRVPESGLWSQDALSRRLGALRPSVVVTVTARSFAPGCVPASSLVVLDFVDRLSVNYGQRAHLAGGLLRPAAFRALAWQMRRFEGRELPVHRRVAAGASDAADLGADWVPNVITVSRAPEPTDATHDLLFVGSLGYEPNVAALRRLAGLWPLIQAARPGTTLLVAGSDPRPEVRELARVAGWTLWENFADIGDVCARARLALATLEWGTGIQNKVLEAAAHGVAQVVTPGVLAGVGADFPAAVAGRDTELVAVITTLLEDAPTRAALATRSRQFVAHRFGVARWAAWGEQVLRSAAAPEVGTMPSPAYPR